MRKEIRIAGFGGQGIILAGVILGEAAMRAGITAVQTQSYGPESRGGAARSEVVLSQGMIDYPKVIKPDILVVLSQPGFDKYGGDIKEGTKVVVDGDLVDAKGEGIRRIPLVKTAEKAGKKVAANIVMLGYLTTAFELVSQHIMRETIVDRIPKGTEELNIRAFEEGCKLGEEHGRQL